jgi:hypothetical protein
MRKIVSRSIALAVVLILANAQAAFAAVSWGAQKAIPGNYAWNYSNSLDYTGTPGGASFKLHEAFVSDASLPEAVKYTSSSNGTDWSKPKTLSGAKNAEGSSIAAAGTTLIAGWFTGYSYYDDPDVPRRLQVNISTNSGGTWSGVQNLTSGTGQIDYPIVAAATTSAGPTNVYAAWVDSKTCDVKFKQSSDGGATWSGNVIIGATTAHLVDAAYGCSGYANIAAVRDLIAVSYVADDTGTLKVARINLNGDASRATNAANWTSSTLADKISLAQNGYPINSASPQNTGVVTVAYNTTTAQRFVRVTGSAVSAPTTIYTNGTIAGKVYTGGYSTAVEPAPSGGYVAMWAGCRDVGLTNPCNYGSAKAKFDLLESTSTNGTSWSATPTQVQLSAVGQQLNDEPSMVVIPGTNGVKVFAQYNVYKSTYNYYDVWMRIGTGSL